MRLPTSARARDRSDRARADLSYTTLAYRVALGKAADDLVLMAEARLTERRFGA
jgi:hypothetical protein